MLFVVKMVFALGLVFELHQNVSISNIWGEGWGKICHFFALTDMLLFFFTNNTSKVISWVINIILILLLHIQSFFPFESCFKL